MPLESFDADIVVAGFGPVGAIMVGLAAQHGLSVIAVDKAAGIHPLPRAAHFDDAVMRIFQSLRVAEELQTHTRPAADYEFRNAEGRMLMRIDAVAQTPLGWCSGYMVHQPGLEQTLRKRVTSLERVDVRLATAFEAFIQNSAGVTVTVRGPLEQNTIRCRYLIGCDGATSPVREMAGIELEDLNFDEPWLVVDVRLGKGARVPEINLQLCDPKRPTTCVLMGPGRHRWEFMLKPGEDASVATAPGFVEDLLAPWDCGVDSVIERRAIYRFHGLVARQWRKGRIFLAGDSAHQMPPFAGQGMCAGVRDASNLAWKLAAVLQGGASETLLDSYQMERDPQVREVIDLAIHMGRVVCTLDPKAAAERDASMFAAQNAGLDPPRPVFKPFAHGFLLEDTPAAGELFPQPTANGVKLDDVLGPDAWLISRAMSPGFRTPTRGLSFFSLKDECLSPFAATLQQWLDQRNVSAVLVRPDRYVFGTGLASLLKLAYNNALTAGNTSPVSE